MDSIQGQEHEFLLAQLEAAAESRAKGSERAAVRSFVRRYYESSSLDALRQRSVDELVETALGHWNFGAQRAAGEIRVQVLPPADAHKVGGGALARLSTCTDDMPFLVDSVSMEIRNAGSSIDWAVHPVLSVRRAAKGEIGAVATAGNDDGISESWIHVEFEALAGGEAYAQLEESLNQVLTDLRTVVEDYEPMRERTRALADAFAATSKGAEAAELTEAAAFLRWLDEGHFTFLG